MTQNPHTPIDESVSFRLVRYNPRRKARGARAAELEISDENGSMALWMNERDLKANVREYGPHEALLEAMVAYTGNEEIAWRRSHDRCTEGRSVETGDADYPDVGIVRRRQPRNTRAGDG